MRIFGRSLLVLLALYALVFPAGDIYLARYGTPRGSACCWRPGSC